MQKSNFFCYWLCVTSSPLRYHICRFADGSNCELNLSELMEERTEGEGQIVEGSSSKDLKVVDKTKERCDWSTRMREFDKGEFVRSFHVPAEVRSDNKRHCEFDAIAVKITPFTKF